VSWKQSTRAPPPPPNINPEPTWRHQLCSTTVDWIEPFWAPFFFFLFDTEGEMIRFSRGRMAEATRLALDRDPDSWAFLLFTSWDATNFSLMDVSGAPVGSKRVNVQQVNEGCPRSAHDRYRLTAPSPTSAHWDAALLFNNSGFILRSFLFCYRKPTRDSSANKSPTPLSPLSSAFKSLLLSWPPPCTPRGPSSLQAQYCCIANTNSAHLEHLEVKALTRCFQSTEERRGGITIETEL